MEEVTKLCFTCYPCDSTELGCTHEDRLDTHYVGSWTGSLT